MTTIKGFLCIVIMSLLITVHTADGLRPHRILLDTDVDTDDLFALLYILKLNRSVFDLQAITINANAWTDSGHAVNHIYDILYMMGRDDIAVGVGGEGGILENGVIMPDVGGYHPIIEQGNTTAGYCRYRQAIPVGFGGRLDIDTNYGLRRSFLPQGGRRYSPLRQPTAQQVMIEKISEGSPITIFTIGASTNLGIFLMSNPQLKKNVEHIYMMGGGVRSRNPTGCCPANGNSTCRPRQCGDRGNLFTDYTSNPYAEFNMFGDPFAAYQVIHSGIPVTLVPLDATNTIPITRSFFEELEKNQRTFEARYCFESLKIARDTWFDEKFYTSYFMWDSFLSGVATSTMLKENNINGENEFAQMEFMNVTVITSNELYGLYDGSNPFFDGLEEPRFGLQRSGVHSGHVQRGLRDPFCVAKNASKGRCKDGYTAEANGSEGARVLVAVRAKANRDSNSPLNREYFRSFIDVLNRKEQSGKFNLTTQFPYYREVHYKPDFEGRKRGKNVVFDMDMSAGDFLALLYLLKAPVEVVDLKAILITPTGWANAATIDVVYDLLHMMGRDDIQVGLGEMFALDQSDPIFPGVGNCTYNRVIPHGSGGFIDSDTLYGLARDLPRSPRRYTAHNSVKFGASRDTENPELRQPLALETWESVVKTLDTSSKITILTNGPLTNVAEILLSDNYSSYIQDIYVVGGRFSGGGGGEWVDEGNNGMSSPAAELNVFLDPLAAKTVFESGHNITLIPFEVQRSVSSFGEMLRWVFQAKKTPEAVFAGRLLSRLRRLEKTHRRYRHMDVFLGEILGAVVLAGDGSVLEASYGERGVKVLLSDCGEMAVDEGGVGSVRVLEDLDPLGYYSAFAEMLGEEGERSAVIGSFEQQKRLWSTPP